MMRKLSFLLLLVPLELFAQSGVLHYELRFSEPHTHYAEVSLQIRGFEEDTLELKMPVWTPGSYLVREFARNVEGLEASNDLGQKISVVKVSKNGWKIHPCRGATIQVKYRIYANELSVRTSHIDESHAYINAASVFMYVKNYKQLPISVKIYPFQQHNKISTSLQASAKDPWLLLATDYDELVDSPIEIGNQKIITYEALGVPHEICLYGDAQFDSERLVSDFRKISEEASKVFGHLPIQRYVTIIHHFPGAGGGLEHKNSTTLHISPMTYRTNWNGVISLFAHEYFHLWNVKRLRPHGLGPFNYDEEVYTDLLWLAEGFTSYYDDLLPVRAGVLSTESYLQELKLRIQRIEQSPGSKVQTLAESSFDTWIKFYRRDENSSNSQVSYYEKGHLAGALINAYVLEKTGGNACLDEVLRVMYDSFALKTDVGFHYQDLLNAVEKVSGNRIDSLMNSWIYSTQSPDYEAAFKPLGIQLNWKKPLKEIRLGMSAALEGNRYVVKSVEKGGTAYVSGLNSGDDILFVNGKSANTHWAELVDTGKPGDRVNLTVMRRGSKKEVVMELKEESRPSLQFSIAQKLSLRQKNMLIKWMGKIPESK
jgi:predicted metalloprotease with PDZ domain